MIIEDRYSSKDFSSVEWGAEELNTFEPCRSCAIRDLSS